MTKGRRRANRIRAVEQAAVICAALAEDTTDEHLAEFIESGQLEAAPEALEYNPAVMAEIARNWN